PMLDWKNAFPNATFHRLSGAESLVALLGDSHADDLVPGLAPEARKHGFGLSHVGVAGCLGVPVRERLWGKRTMFPLCQEVANAALSRFLADRRVRIIALAARGSV